MYNWRKKVTATHKKVDGQTNPLHAKFYKYGLRPQITKPYV